MMDSYLKSLYKSLLGDTIDYKIVNLMAGEPHFYELPQKNDSFIYAYGLTVFFDRVSMTTTKISIPLIKIL